MPSRRATPEIDIGGHSALQRGALMAAGVLDPVDVTERTLHAIATCEDGAIFTQVTAERARLEARAAARRIRAGRPRGPLDGVPIAWKDLFDLDGMVTTAGSRVLDREPPAASDAAVVARLCNAGMVCVGRANMTEFAYSGIGINPHYGTPRNPHGRDNPRIPGGSSSGSGVAVARGLVPVSIGTDTSGSVRIPAALNGTIGFMASSGRYPVDGVFPLSFTLDRLGVLCRSVADAVVVDAAMRGAMVPAARPLSPRRLRVVVPTNIVFDDTEPAVVANFQAAIDRLARIGIHVERTALAAFDDIIRLYTTHGMIGNAEAWFIHKTRLTTSDAERMDRRVVARARLGAVMKAEDYIALLRARATLIAATDALLGTATLVATPTVAHTAPPIAGLEANDEAFFKINLKTLRNPMLANFLGWCAVSVPNGTDDRGLPTGLSLAAPHGADDFLLSAALTAEAVLRDETA